MNRWVLFLIHKKREDRDTKSCISSYALGLPGSNLFDNNYRCPAGHQLYHIVGQVEAQDSTKPFTFLSLWCTSGIYNRKIPKFSHGGGGGNFIKTYFLFISKLSDYSSDRANPVFEYPKRSEYIPVTVKSPLSLIRIISTLRTSSSINSEKNFIKLSILFCKWKAISYLLVRHNSKLNLIYTVCYHHINNPRQILT